MRNDGITSGRIPIDYMLRVVPIAWSLAAGGYPQRHNRGCD